MVSKMVDIHLNKGQRIRLETPGGGGYGSALERDPSLVADDARLGYVTSASALKEYNCVVSEDGVLNVKETNLLRGKG